MVLGFNSVLVFIGFLVVKSLVPSFSTSFLGEEGFLLATAEPGLGEAVYKKYRVID